MDWRKANRFERVAACREINVGEGPSRREFYLYSLTWHSCVVLCEWVCMCVCVTFMLIHSTICSMEAFFSAWLTSFASWHLAGIFSLLYMADYMCALFGYNGNDMPHMLFGTRHTHTDRKSIWGKTSVHAQIIELAMLFHCCDRVSPRVHLWPSSGAKIIFMLFVELEVRGFWKSLMCIWIFYNDWNFGNGQRCLRIVLINSVWKWIQWRMWRMCSYSNPGC